MSIQTKFWRHSLLATLLATSAARAACESDATEKCWRDALLNADHQLNLTFKRIITARPQGKAEEIRANQRLWLADRNTTCRLKASATTTADWTAKVATNPAAAKCIYNSTMARIGELQSIPTAANVDDYIERQTYSFPTSHTSGKYYAEVVLNVRGSDNGPTSTHMQIGVIDPAASMVGTQFDVASLATRALPTGEYVVGLGIDLDGGKLYISNNGVWAATPGSTEGVGLQRGQPYSLHVETPGRLLSAFLRLNAVKINTGNEPFQFATPPGYQPYYRNPGNVDGGSRLDWIVPVYLKTANASIADWAERYWAWMLVKPPERNPVSDTTGVNCADAQDGPVWFLASADAASHVQRHCTIPRGKFVLLPALATMLQSTASPLIGKVVCSKLEGEHTAEIGAANIRGVYVTIDGQRFDTLYDHRIRTPKCEAIRSPSGQTVVSDVMYVGAWIMLQPLPAGDHTISFGARLDDLKVNRDVTYNVHVD